MPKRNNSTFICVCLYIQHRGTVCTGNKADGFGCDGPVQPKLWTLQLFLALLIMCVCFYGTQILIVMSCPFVYFRSKIKNTIVVLKKIYIYISCGVELIHLIQILC